MAELQGNQEFLVLRPRPSILHFLLESVSNFAIIFQVMSGITITKLVGVFVLMFAKSELFVVS